MNAKEVLGMLEPNWIVRSEYRDAVLRALRLLAAAEGGEGTPETDACADWNARCERIGDNEIITHGLMLALAHDEGDELRLLSRRLERERNALAARVGELEKDAERYRWLRVQRHADIAACWYLPVLPQDYPVDTPEQRDIAIDAARSK